MTEMTWEQKLYACNALAPCAMMMRGPGDWYVSQCSVEVSQGGMMVSPSGNGKIPEYAVHDHWQQLTNLKPGEYLVIDAMAGPRRRAVKWNGFMWQGVEENLRKEAL